VTTRIAVSWWISFSFMTSVLILGCRAFRLFTTILYEYMAVLICLLCFFNIDHAFLRAFLRRLYSDSMDIGFLRASNGSRSGTRFALGLGFFSNNGNTKSCFKRCGRGIPPPQTQSENI